MQPGIIVIGRFLCKFAFQSKELEELKIKAKTTSNVANSLDEACQSLSVKRQKYHGKSFVGNDVGKMLKVLNFI